MQIFLSLSESKTWRSTYVTTRAVVIGLTTTIEEKSAEKLYSVISATSRYFLINRKRLSCTFLSGENCKKLNSRSLLHFLRTRGPVCSAGKVVRRSIRRIDALAKTSSHRRRSGCIHSFSFASSSESFERNFKAAADQFTYSSDPIENSKWKKGVEVGALFSSNGANNRHVNRFSQSDVSVPSRGVLYFDCGSSAQNMLQRKHGANEY